MEMSRQELIREIRQRIDDELKFLSLEELREVLNGLFAVRIYKSAHVPQDQS